MNALRRAARSLRLRPAYTAICIALLALGVGAVSGIFAIVDVAMLRPLPYTEPSRLEWLRTVEPVAAKNTGGLAPVQLVRWRSETHALAQLEGALPKTITMAGTSDPEALHGMQVSAGLFSLLGAAPALGRPFTRDEEFTASTVAIISHEFWQRRLGGDPGVIGRSVTLDDVPRTVVGVMPKGFTVIFISTDVFVPLPLEASEMTSKFRGNLALGRLKPGVTIAQATTDLDRINDEIGSEIPQFRRTRARVEPLREALFGSERTSLLVMFGAVSLLLAIALANVVNLALSDGLARRHSTMVRLALGGARRHIVALRLLEALIISLSAGLLGLVMGRLALAALQSVNPSFFEGYGDLALDARMVIATFVLAIVAGVVATLPVALGESRLGIATLASAEVRSVGGRGDRRVREFLLGAQVAVALVLLFGASLLARNLSDLTSAPQGFDAPGLLAVEMVMPARYVTPAQRANYLARVVGSVAQLTGVEGASASQSYFSLGSSAMAFQAIQGEALSDSTGFLANIRHVMPDVFGVMHAHMVNGRALGAADREGTVPVAVVNSSYARRYLPGGAIGAHVRRTAIPDPLWMEIVGVVDDVKDAGVGADVGPTIYVPYLQENQASVAMTILARLRGTGTMSDRTVQRAIWSVDPGQAIKRVVPVGRLETESAAQPRFQALMLTLFSTAALVLVIGGIYALTLFSIMKRTREMGVRAALGATPTHLVTDSLWQGLRPVAFGTCAGLVLALPAMRLMQNQLSHGLAASDLPRLGIVLAAMLAATSAAAFIPARRAARIPPVIAMRA